MYYKQLNILICSRDPVIETAVRQTKPLERFGHHFRVVRDSVSEENSEFVDDCRDADILIFDVPATQIPDRLRDLCGTKHPYFVFCERPDQGQVADARIVEHFAVLWAAPFTTERVRHFLKRLLQHIKIQKLLAYTQRCWDTAIDSVPDLVWYKDVRGAHIKVNNSFCKLVGKTKAQCYKRGHNYIWDMDAEEYSKGEYVCLESEDIVMKAKKTCVFDEKIKGPDGMLQFRTYF